jgi:hypothetical protein
VVVIFSVGNASAAPKGEGIIGTMTRSRWLLVVLLSLLPIVSCTKGDECDTCTSDADCNDGFVCTNFSDGSTRCGSGVGGTNCRVR